MIIVGEKINGTLKNVATAIQARDTAFIQNLARRQVAAGAQMLDVNAGTLPESEPEDMRWLVTTVQSVFAVPLWIDSTNPAALRAGLEAHQGKPVINSVTGEKKKLETILPLAREFGCGIVGLAMDDEGVPHSAQKRLAVVETIVNAAARLGVSLQEIYIDPLVLAISTNTEEGLIFLETLRGVKQHFPEVKTTVGLSNVSFGLPQRSLLNRTLLVLALGAGLDAALINPLDPEMIATIRAVELLLNRDEYCMEYLRAHRQGKLSTN